KLEKNLGGIKDMTKLPGAVFVVDTKKEHIAVAEARKLGIPVVAVVDTNCDPDDIDYVIPGNDDAVRAIRIFVAKAAEACRDGNAIHQKELASRKSSEGANSKEGGDKAQHTSGPKVEVVRAPSKDADDNAAASV